MRPIDLSDYTEERMKSLCYRIEQITKAFIANEVIRSRNVMVFDHDPTRVVWIDFDQALTVDEATRKKEEKELLRSDLAIVQNYLI